MRSRGENGDDEPQILVNGRPRPSSTLPTCRSRRSHGSTQLPRGTAVAVGGKPGQRAYNVVLRP